MAFRVLIMGSIPDDLRRDLALLEDEVEIVLPPEGRPFDASRVASMRPHLLVFGQGAAFGASALYGPARGARVEDPVPSLALASDPSADLVLPAASGTRDEVLRLARRLGRLRRAALEGQAGVARSGASGGLLGVDAFRARLEYEYSRAVRYRHPVSLVTLTLDGRDALAATYGTTAVDEFQATLEDTLRRCLRDVDLLYRVEDHEIAAVLPETTAAGARIPADRFLTQTTRLIFKPSAATARPMLPLKATPSIGVADGPRAGVASADDLLTRARESMGSARSAGGARVFVHGAPSEGAAPALG